MFDVKVYYSVGDLLAVIMMCQSQLLLSEPLRYKYHGAVRAIQC